VIAVKTLQLHFLGERNYLHGTTLFDALCDYCMSGSNISFRVQRMIETDRVAAESFDPASGGASRFSATLVWNEASSAKGIGVVPMEPSATRSRIPFDEVEIVGRAEFAGATVVTCNPGNDSLVRNIVALNKALLFKLLQPSLPGQWLFARLDLDRYAATFGELRLAYRTRVGFAAVSSVIEIDGCTAGSVVFSWLKK
jgi:hypothetical protein